MTLVTQQLIETEALAGAFAAMQRARTQALIVQQSTFTRENRIPQSLLVSADKVIE